MLFTPIHLRYKYMQIKTNFKRENDIQARIHGEVWGVPTPPLLPLPDSHKKQ